MKLIPLGGKNLVKGKSTFKGFAMVDDEDFERVSQFNWYAKYRSSTKDFEAVTNLRKNGTARTLRMHRLIMGEPKGLMVDHKNHNSLDNQQVNLRVCTRHQNARNSLTPTNNTSGYKGVSRKKESGKWQAYISVNNKRKYLGYFTSPELAAEAYNKAAIGLHGEFAYLNKVLTLQIRNKMV